MNNPTARIETLRTEAARAGDHAQALICDIALGKIDAEEGYEHLRIWSFLSESDKRKIRNLGERYDGDTYSAAWAACADAIEAGRG